jgi:hypothetical protein
MRYKLLDGQFVGAYQTFEYEGTQYPSNWLAISTPEALAAMGVTIVEDPPRPDDQFYWVSENNVATPKDLADLKPLWIDRVNRSAYALLLSSDWMVTRKAEIGTDIPADWAAYRAQVRVDCAASRVLITNAVDVEALIAVVTALTWPMDPNAELRNV